MYNDEGRDSPSQQPNASGEGAGGGYIHGMDVRETIQAGADGGDEVAEPEDEEGAHRSDETPQSGRRSSIRTCGTRDGRPIEADLVVPPRPQRGRSVPPLAGGDIRRSIGLIDATSSPVCGPMSLNRTMPQGSCCSES